MPANNYYLNPGRLLAIPGGAMQTQATPATTALSTQYTFGSAGAAVDFRFGAVATDTIDHILVWVSATTGTGNTISAELRNYGAAGAPLAPGTLVTNGSASAASGTTASKWVKLTFGTPPSVTLGSIYHLLVANAAADAATNNFSIGRSACAAVGESVWTGLGDNITTANGFNTAGTDSTTTPLVVIVYTSGKVQGCSYTLGNQSIAVSNTRERGLVWQNGPTEQLSVVGAVGAWNRFSGISGYKIYTGNTAPGGSALLTVTFGTDQLDMGAIYHAAVTLPKATTARFILTANSANQNPTALQIGDFTTYATDLQAAGAMGGNLGLCQDNGSGGWTDQYNYLPRMEIIVADQIAVAGGGGGPSLNRIVSGV